MNSNQPIPQVGARKFKDPIPFILFVIFTFSFTAYLSMTADSSQIANNVLQAPIVGIVIVSMFLTLGLMVITFLYAPEAALHASFLILPITMLAMSIVNGNAIFVTITLISSIINLLLYFLVYRKRIKYAAAVLKVSAKIILPYLFFLTMLAGVFTAYVILLSIMASEFMNGSKGANYLLGVGFLYLYWNFFNTLYTFRVFCSSIVSTQALSRSHISLFSTLSISFKNTIFCLGSICLAGLLIALVATIRSMVRENRRNEPQSQFASILQTILIAILAMIEDILNFANEWVFVYMAIYGKSYRESMKDAYRELTTGNNMILVDSLAMEPLLRILGFSGCIIYIIVFVVLNIPNGKEFDSKMVIPLVILTIFYIYIVNYFIVIFDSAGKAFLFSYNRGKQIIKDKYPETYEVLESMKPGKNGF